MPVHERRQHFRIDDRVYFDYRILAPGELCSDTEITHQLLGEKGHKFMEAAQYLQDIDKQMTNLTQDIGVEHPGLAHYLNLLNLKIDYVSRNMLMTGDIDLRKVNLSLGGMAFKTTEQVKEQSLVKLVLYTKPKMIPIVLDGKIVYSQYQGPGFYRTSIQFNGLTQEQEQLLSQHILLAQVNNRSD